MLRSVDWCLGRWGYQKTRRLLLRTSPRPRRDKDQFDRAAWVGRVVNFSAGRAGMDDTCLRRSLATWWVLRWMGIPSDITVGVRFTPEGPQIHAWVDHHGVPVNDVPTIAHLYPITHDGDLSAELDRGLP